MGWEAAAAHARNDYSFWDDAMLRAPFTCTCRLSDQVRCQLTVLIGGPNHLRWAWTSPDAMCLVTRRWREPRMALIPWRALTKLRSALEETWERGERGLVGLAARACPVPGAGPLVRRWAAG